MTSMMRTNTELDLGIIAAPVAKHWDRAEQILVEQFRTPPPWLERLMSDRAIFGGKRLRPLLLLLSGSACGDIREGHLVLAAAIEMIHLATLIHDDLIDGATTRRQMPTVNVEHGPTNSVLLGDWLYAQAFVLAARSQSTAAVDALARSIRSVCDGEIRQHYCQGDFDLSLDDYLAMIEGKTASLCAAACEIGAIMSHATTDQRAAMASFGRHLGVAFQIVDDILDLVGSPERMGKTLGTDLANRRVTAPLIFALSCEPPAIRARVRRMVDAPTVDATGLLSLIEESGALQLSWELAKRHCRLAQAISRQVADEAIAQAFVLLTEFVAQRTY